MSSGLSCRSLDFVQNRLQLTPKKNIHLPVVMLLRFSLPRKRRHFRLSNQFKMTDDERFGTSKRNNEE